MFAERLGGLALIVIGAAMLVALRFLSQAGTLVPPPPGMPSGIGLVNPLACLLPFVGLGAGALILVGIWRLLAPTSESPARRVHSSDDDDDWRERRGPDLIP